MSPSEACSAFFLQMLFILAACRLVGALSRRLGQPQVIGEMIAGVFLGPSLLGLVAPGLYHHVFPKESLSVLYVTAQLGAGLYMFLVGSELDTDTLRQHLRSALAVSTAGIVVPFGAAAGISVWTFGLPGFYSPGIRLFEAVLFMGAALSITAFPVLARIIYERGLTGTPLGTLALAAGAIDDGCAWCLLAIVMASLGADASIAGRAFGGGIVYVALMLLLVRPMLRKLSFGFEKRQGMPLELLAAVLMLFLAAVWFTDRIGMHAIFGGFTLGAVMPRGILTKTLREQLEPVTTVFLLPVFFAYSGLQTRLNLISTPSIFLISLVVIAAACLGKGGACWAAARLSGEGNRTALGVAALMNARGLMELILVNIGLEKGIIQPRLFAMLVLMTIATTLMATPLFEWVYGRHATRLAKFQVAVARV